MLRHPSRREHSDTHFLNQNKNRNLRVKIAMLPSFFKVVSTSIKIRQRLVKQPYGVALSNPNIYYTTP
jgi:hypothetical protein